MFHNISNIKKEIINWCKKKKRGPPPPPEFFFGVEGLNFFCLEKQFFLFHKKNRNPRPSVRPSRFVYWLKQKLWCLFFNLFAGDLGRPSCLVVYYYPTNN